MGCLWDNMHRHYVEELGLQKNDHLGSTSFHTTDALTGPFEKPYHGFTGKITLGSPKFENMYTLHTMVM